MVIITWKQRGGRHAETYTMRAVVKPCAARTEPPFVVEREHTDAAGGRGWIPAAHEYANTVVCKALLMLAADLPSYAQNRAGALLTIDLGGLDLPED